MSAHSEDDIDAGLTNWFGSGTSSGKSRTDHLDPDSSSGPVEVTTGIRGANALMKVNIMAHCSVAYSVDYSTDIRVSAANPVPLLGVIGVTEAARAEGFGRVSGPAL